MDPTRHHFYLPASANILEGRTLQDLKIDKIMVITKGGVDKIWCTMYITYIYYIIQPCCICLGFNSLKLARL